MLVALATLVVGFLAFEDYRRLGNAAVVMPPLLFDVNDDGAEDAVIILNPQRPARQLCAVDANTGATLWKTADLGTDVEHVAIVTADNKVRSVNLATGTLTPSSTPDVLTATAGELSCPPASSTFSGFGRGVRFESWPSGRIEGMTTSTLLRFGADTLPALVLGRRAEGSALPMLAGVRDERTVWKVELPSSAPLEVEAGDPTAATIAAARVYASYQRPSTPGFTVVAVTLSNGQRQWEAAVPRGRNASVTLRASDRHVFARADTSLYALSTTDGRLLWRVG